MNAFFRDRNQKENLKVIKAMKAEIKKMGTSNTGYYDAQYLDFAQDALGEYCRLGEMAGYPSSLWLGMFVRTRVGQDWGKGILAAILEHSGTELADCVRTFYYGVSAPIRPSCSFLGISAEDLEDRGHYWFGRNMALLGWYMKTPFQEIMFDIPFYEAFGYSTQIIDEFHEDGQYLFIDEMKRLHEHRMIHGVPVPELEAIFA